MKRATAGVAVVLLAVGCMSKDDLMDDAWEGFSGDERGNACSVFEAEGAEGYAAAAVRGNSAMTETEARDWAALNLPTYCKD